MEEKCFSNNKEVMERVIIKNELAFAFPSNKPIVPGHVLVCPVRCVANFDELSKDELKAIFDLREKLTSAMKKTFQAEGFNYAWNEGEASGQSIPHFHLHILPRKKSENSVLGYEPRKFLYRPVPQEAREESSEEDLKELARLIKESIE